MLAKVEFESMGLKGFVNNVPSTAEEYDQLAGRPGACLKAATDYTMFHKVLGYFRSDVAEAVVEATAIPMITKPHPDGKKDETGVLIQIVDEKPAVFVPRAAAKLGQPVAGFQSVADAVCLEYEFKDFVTDSGRGPRASVPLKKDLETATLVLADEARLARSIANMRKEGVSIEDKPTVQQFALGIKQLRAALEAKQLV